ncbi:MAG: acyltransferase family protein, partial [Ilumatobacter sp.]|nr:acyltransferase family protein [Ilumatobacter sp.]
ALPLVAVGSSALILALQRPSGLRHVLSHDAPVWVGKISYGLYLFHWPVFVLIHPDRLDWGAGAIFAVRIVVTSAITIVSYELLEQPIRLQASRRPPITFAAAGLSTAALVVLAVSVVPGRLGEYWQADPVAAEAAAIEVSAVPLGALLAPAAADDTGSTGSTASTTPAAETVVTTTRPPSTEASDVTVPVTTPSAPVIPPLPELSRPVRIVVTGDSTAEAFGVGLVNWAAANPTLAQVETVTAPGCGFLEGGERRTGDTIAPIEGCDGWVDEFLYPEIERLQPDVVMAMVSSWDIVDRRWDTVELLTPFDDGFRTRLERDYADLVDALAEHGAFRIAFVRHPIPDPFWLPAADAQEDPVRHQVIYDVYDDLAAADPLVDVVMLDRWMTVEGLDRSEDVRPDGIHPTPESATAVSEAYLGEQLLRVALGLDRP